MTEHAVSEWYRSTLPSSWLHPGGQSLTFVIQIPTKRDRLESIPKMYLFRLPSE